MKLKNLLLSVLAIAGATIAHAQTPVPNGTLQYLSGAAGNAQLFTLTVPAGQVVLDIRTYGVQLNGNVDLYVKLDSAPTTTDYTFKSTKPTSMEVVSQFYPAAGTYYILVKGVTAYQNVGFKAEYRIPKGFPGNP
jgi:hypothetical protein